MCFLLPHPSLSAAHGAQKEGASPISAAGVFYENLLLLVQLFFTKGPSNL